VPYLDFRDRKDGSTAYRVKYRAAGREKAVTFQREDEARRWCDIANVNLDDALRLLDQPAPEASTASTVETVVATYIRDRTGIGDGTREDYRRHLRRDIAPHLGDIPVDQLTRSRVEQWINTLSAKPLAPKTVENRHSLLSGGMSYAVREGLVPENPCTGIAMPVATGDEGEMVFLEPEEFDLLAAHIPRWYEPLINLLVLTGLRWGEASALQVGDVDLEGRTIDVRRAWKYHPSGTPFLGTPKSRAGRRTVEFDPDLTPMIEPLIRRRPGGAWVFLNRQGRPLRNNSFHHRTWRPAVAAATSLPSPPADIEPGTLAYRRWACGAAGLPGPRLSVRPRVHDLRHTFAAWCLNASPPVPLYVLKSVMGHESLSMTADRYGHLQKDRIGLAASASGAARRGVSRPDR
jgi:integrase